MTDETQKSGGTGKQWEPPKGFDPEVWRELVKKMAERERLRAKQTEQAIQAASMRRMLIVGLAALITGVIGLYTALSGTQTAGVGGAVFRWPLLVAEEDPVTTRRIAELDGRMAVFSSSIELMEKKFDELPLSSSGPGTLEVTEIKALLEDARKRLDILENAISESPEKALALPLMRRDVEYLEKRLIRNEDDVKALAAAIDSVRTLIIYGMWALLITGITSILGWVSMRLVKRRGASLDVE